MGSPTIVSLFSGIGGLDIGVEAATGGEVLLNCEADAYCRRVLAKRWPGAHQLDDIRGMYHALPWMTDLIIGGFPCQDLSVAGKMKGLDGERSGLWFEMLRVIEASAPGSVFIENVLGIRKRGLATVVRGLAELGYSVVWSPLSAGHVGAPHRRNRMWIYARHEESGCNLSLRGPAASSWKRGAGDVEPWERDVQRVLPKGRHPGRVQRLKAIGNAVVPECARQAFLLLNEEMDDLERTVPTTAGDRTFPTKDGHPPLGGALVEGQFVSITRIDKASRLKKLITYPTPTYPTPQSPDLSAPLPAMADTGSWPSWAAGYYREVKRETWWATPTVKGNYNKASLSSKAGDGLATEVKRREKWATPTVQDSANNGGAAQFRRNSLPLNAEAGGPLNPTWVELLMGFEPDHTEVIE